MGPVDADGLVAVAENTMDSYPNAKVFVDEFAIHPKENYCHDCSYPDDTPAGPGVLFRRPRYRPSVHGVTCEFKSEKTRDVLSLLVYGALRPSRVCVV